MTSIESFVEARYGLFIHFGLYSLLGRGEWVMNREELQTDDLRALADRFNPTAFDAEAIADLAVAGGMKYLVFTTMHHEGFRMYHSELTDFCSTKTAAQRDFVAEIIAAAKKRGLMIGLYHSLNNWFDQPDAVSAWEDRSAYETFIQATHQRIRELVVRYPDIDILWYDGWWPFDARGWRSEAMNAMVREIQPHILFNGRNCLPGDFATPEQHLSAPTPWRPWEACVTLNDNWGFHAGDQHWKSPLDVIRMLIRIAQAQGNLLLNIGPDGLGNVPEESRQIIHKVGQWLKINGECIFNTERWSFDPQHRGDHRGDWSNHGSFTVRGNSLYFIATSRPVDRLVFTGLEMNVNEVTLLGHGSISFNQAGSRIEIPLESLPCPSKDSPQVFRFDCDCPPSIYKTGGTRIPAIDHPRYDPAPSDISW